jgi:O-antigen ligase
MRENKIIVNYLVRLESYLILLFIFSLSFYKDDLFFDKIPPLLLIIWAVISLCKITSSKSFKKLNIFFFILTGFYLLHAIGLIYSENLDSGLFNMEKKLTFFILPVLIVLSSPFYFKKKHYLLAFVAGTFLSSMICLLLGLVHGGTDNFFYDKFSYFLHPSYFAMYIIFSIHILWQFVSNDKSIKLSWKLILYSIMVYFAIIVYLLSSKIGIISGIISLILILFREIKTQRKLSKKLIFPLFLIMIFLLSGFFNYRFQVLSDNMQQTPNENTHTRFLIWNEAKEIIEKNFIFGVGTGDTRDSLNTRYLLNGYTDSFKHKLNAHNQYLETFIALGLIGFLVLVSLLIGPIIYFRKNLDNLPVIFLFLIGFNLFFESMFERFWGIVFFAFFFSFFFISKPSKKFNS